MSRHNAQLRAAASAYENECECCSGQSDNAKARAALAALPAFIAEAVQNIEPDRAEALAAAVTAGDGAAVLNAIEAVCAAYAEIRITDAMTPGRDEDRAIERLTRLYSGPTNWAGLSTGVSA